MLSSTKVRNSIHPQNKYKQSKYKDLQKFHIYLIVLINKNSTFFYQLDGQESLDPEIHLFKMFRFKKQIRICAKITDAK